MASENAVAAAARARAPVRPFSLSAWSGGNAVVTSPRPQQNTSRRIRKQPTDRAGRITIARAQGDEESAQVRVAEAGDYKAEDVDVGKGGAAKGTETLGEVLRKRRATAGGAGGAQTSSREAEAEGLQLEKINPYIIGRKSRAVFDEAWSKLSRLGSSLAGSADFFDGAEDLEAPQVIESPRGFAGPPRAPFDTASHRSRFS